MTSWKRSPSHISLSALFPPWSLPSCEQDPYDLIPAMWEETAAQGAFRNRAKFCNFSRAHTGAIVSVNKMYFDN